MTKRILSILLCITLLCVSVVYAAPEPELVNLAQMSTTILSASATPSYSTTLEHGVDGNLDTFCWINAKPGNRAWYAMDFGSAYELASIKLKNRSDEVTNINYFKIEAANNEDFSDAVELFIDNETIWANGAVVEVNVDDTNKYRYLRVIKLQNNHRNLVFADLEVVGYVLPSELSVEKITVGNTELSDGDTISESADYVEIDFTNTIDFDLIDDESITVTSDGEPMSFECLHDSSSGDKLTLAFKKALTKGETLSITLNTIFDAYTQTLSDSYTFEIGEGTEAKSVITVDSPTSDDEGLHITGAIKSSKDVGIAGRRIVLYAAAPGGTEEYIDELISGEDGSFEFVYQIPTDSSFGTFTFGVDGDYATERAETSYAYADTTLEEVNLLDKGIATYEMSGSAPYASAGYAFENAFDNKNDTSIYVHKGWIQAELFAPMQITRVDVRGRHNSTEGTSNISAYASADGEEWVTLGVISTSEIPNGELRTVICSSTEKFKYIRIASGAYNNTSNLLCLSEVDVYGYFVPPAPEINRVSFDDEAISDGDTVPRGIDHFILNFSVPLNEASITDENISLSADGESIPLAFDYADDKITIMLKKSLEQNQEVKLILNGLRDIFSQDFSGEYTFTVGGEDRGSASTTIDKPVKESDGVKIRGIMKSSKDVGIEGRKVYLYVGTPNGSVGDTPVAETVSGTDGAYEFTYIFDEVNDVNGRYTFCTDGEYTEAKASDNYVFMNSELETSILGSLKQTEDADGVKSVFTSENYSSMGILPVEDREVIEGYDEFYEHFAGKDYSSVEELSKAYEEYVVLEMVNQASVANDIADIIYNPANCEKLGISNDRISKVQAKKMRMCADILALEAAEEVEDFSEACTKIIERYVASEVGKTDVDLVDNTQSIYAGQGAQMELAFLNEETSVSSVSFTLTSTNADALNNVNVSLDIEGQYTTSLMDDVLTINIIPVRIMEKAQRFGTVILTTSSDSSGYSVTMAGSVAYEKVWTKKNADGKPLDKDGNALNEEGYILDDAGNATEKKSTPVTENITVTTNLIPKTSAVSFTQQSSGGTGNKNDGNTSRPSGSFGGGGNGGMTVTPVVPVADNKTYFGDLASSEWAREAIEALTDKGIVSQSADGKFYPERNITREEFTKLMVMAMNLYDASAAYPFTDGDTSAWYAPYIASAYKAGIVTGKADGSFGAGENITREDMATIIYRAAKLTAIGDAAGFADDALISDYAREAVYALRALGIVNGVSDTEFAPKNNATRAMAAKMIYEMLKEVA